MMIRAGSLSGGQFVHTVAHHCIGGGEASAMQTASRNDIHQAKWTE